MSLCMPPHHEDPVTHFAVYERGGPGWALYCVLELYREPACALRMPATPRRPRSLMVTAVFASGKISPGTVIRIPV
jgi:hypothetical protein